MTRSKPLRSILHPFEGPPERVVSNMPSGPEVVPRTSPRSMVMSVYLFRSRQWMETVRRLLAGRRPSGFPQIPTYFGVRE